MGGDPDGMGPGRPWSDGAFPLTPDRLDGRGLGRCWPQGVLSSGPRRASGLLICGREGRHQTRGPTLEETGKDRGGPGVGGEGGGREDGEVNQARSGGKGSLCLVMRRRPPPLQSKLQGQEPATGRGRSGVPAQRVSPPPAGRSSPGRRLRQGSRSPWSRCRSRSTGYISGCRVRVSSDRRSCRGRGCRRGGSQSTYPGASRRSGCRMLRDGVWCVSGGSSFFGRPLRPIVVPVPAPYQTLVSVPTPLSLSPSRHGPRSDVETLSLASPPLVLVQDPVGKSTWITDTLPTEDHPLLTPKI